MKQRPRIYYTESQKTLMWERWRKGESLQQIAAIRGAVNGLMGEVLEGHIREHLGADAASPKERAEDLEQVVGVLRSYLR